MVSDKNITSHLSHTLHVNYVTSICKSMWLFRFLPDVPWQGLNYELGPFHVRVDGIHIDVDLDFYQCTIKKSNLIVTLSTNKASELNPSHIKLSCHMATQSLVAYRGMLHLYGSLICFLSYLL